MGQKAKLNQGVGAPKIQNNQDQGRSGGGTPTRRRRIDSNSVRGGGINRPTAGAKGGRGFSGS